MNFLITGEKGFIGSEVMKSLLKSGHNVFPFWDNSEFAQHEHFDYFLHFGAPSSVVLYYERLDECVGDTVRDFLKVISFCRKKHIKLIYPSSATVYENSNPYSHTKSALEQIQEAYNIPSLALRIFAGYGPGEAHKKDYASIVYQFIQKIRQGEPIEIFGDGSQSRDFVYIDDIVRTIIANLNATGYIDIGTGVSTSFNEIVDLVSTRVGKEPIIKWVGHPKNYIHQTICKNPITDFIAVEDGINRIVSQSA